MCPSQAKKEDEWTSRNEAEIFETGKTKLQKEMMGIASCPYAIPIIFIIAIPG
jgi:hypothetical protein